MGVYWLFRNDFLSLYRNNLLYIPQNLFPVTFMWLANVSFYCVCCSVTPFNTLLWSDDESLLGSVPFQLFIWVSSGILWISAMNFWKESPCNGFLKWLGKHFNVGQYFTFRSPITIQSLFNKYLIRMWLFIFPLHNLPLLLRSMAVRFYWYITASSTLNPCTLIKYLNHSNAGIMSSDPISFASVEILELIFCLFDMLVTDPHLK